MQDLPALVAGQPQQLRLLAKNLTGSSGTNDYLSVRFEINPNRLNSLGQINDFKAARAAVEGVKNLILDVARLPMRFSSWMARVGWLL